MSDEMKEFVKKNLKTPVTEKEKFKRLIHLIYNKDFLNLQYEDNKTYTASETFTKRRGNCLSYTAMFIALARHAGLRAYFQEVNDLSNWKVVEDVTIFSKHVNALVIAEGERYEVDFKSFSNNLFLGRKRISDERAEANYYNNKAVEFFLVGRLKTAERLLRLSLGSDFTFSPAWTNLGLIRQRENKNKMAELNFKRAIQFDRDNHTARYNLSLLYEKLGFKKKAAVLKKKIKKYLKKNPYYQFNLGNEYFKRGKVSVAIEYYLRAYRKLKTEPEINSKLAIAYFRLSDLKKTRRYLKMCEKYSRSEDERELYRKKHNYIYEGMLKLDAVKK